MMKNWILNEDHRKAAVKIAERRLKEFPRAIYIKKSRRDIVRKATFAMPVEAKRIIAAYINADFAAELVNRHVMTVDKKAILAARAMALKIKRKGEEEARKEAYPLKKLSGLSWCSFEFLTEYVRTNGKPHLFGYMTKFSTYVITEGKIDSPYQY